MKIYVVCRVAFDYNDEVYHTGNYGESFDVPSQAFKDEAKANALAQEMNIDNMVKAELYCYAYSVDELFTPRGIAMLDTMGMDPSELESLSLNREQAQQLLPEAKIVFAKVIATELT